MSRYILKSTIRAAFTLLAVSLIVFSLARLAGSPLDVLADPNLGEEGRRAVMEYWGLDQPLPAQYLTFIVNAVRGDFGQSFKFPGEGVTDVLLRRLPPTLQLGAVGLLLTVLIGIPIGVISAVKRGSLIDKIAKGLALIGQSVPEFWLGIVLIWIFAVQLGWVPTGGQRGWSSVILPAFVTAMFGIAALLRLLRSSMLDTLGTEYVKLAHLKGVRRSVVVWKHAFKAASIAPLTFFGRILVHLASGATVVEVVFAWPGWGLLAFEAANARDYAVVQALALITCAMFVFVNLGVDFLYAYVDPRVRLGGRAAAS